VQTYSKPHFYIVDSPGRITSSYGAHATLQKIASKYVHNFSSKPNPAYKQTNQCHHPDDDFVWFGDDELINTGVVNCLIMCQNARKMHHSEAKKSGYVTQPPPQTPPSLGGGRPLPKPTHSALSTSPANKSPGCASANELISFIFYRKKFFGCQGEGLLAASTDYIVMVTETFFAVLKH